MNQIEGIILDWAGTTVDFGCFAPVNTFLHVFRSFGIEVTPAEARGPMGLLKRDHIKTMLQMERIQAAWVAKHDRNSTEQDIDLLYAGFEPLLMATLRDFTQPLPGVVETVKLLRNQGLKLGSTTGYTDAMMQIVAAGAKANGYEPDYWITPDSTRSIGRPYPYMIYRNMEALTLPAPCQVVKVGDTAADIQEGLQAGVWSVGVIVGSSQMGLTQAEYENLSETEKQQAVQAVEQSFLAYGADFTIRTIQELPQLIETINTWLLRKARPSGT
jgi:phosphonoacetaldehyde hydrolase